MSELIPSPDFKKQLLDLQPMSSTLRASYDKELDALLHPPLTFRRALPGTALLAMLLPFTVLIVRVMILYDKDPLYLVAHGALAAAFAWVSFLILRSLWLRKFIWKSYFSVSQTLTLAAGILTVAALIHGLRAPSDPASTFGALYVSVFLGCCYAWALDDRIRQSELANREQLLRIECRLADLAQRPPHSQNS